METVPLSIWGPLQWLLTSPCGSLDAVDRSRPPVGSVGSVGIRMTVDQTVETRWLTGSMDLGSTFGGSSHLMLMPFGGLSNTRPSNRTLGAGLYLQLSERSHPLTLTPLDCRKFSPFSAWSPLREQVPLPLPHPVNFAWIGQSGVGRWMQVGRWMEVGRWANLPHKQPFVLAAVPKEEGKYEG